MILIVDDDEDMLELIATALEDDNHQTTCFSSAEKALDWLAANKDISLIISDINMPLMDGFKFKQEFSRLYPNRCTSFLFLSSLSDPENIIKGLDLGADDYMTKPVNPLVLRAKIRSLLKNIKRRREPLFLGDISKFPFIKLLQFCENRKHSGEITINSSALSATVKFEGGELIENTPGIDEHVLEDLMNLTEGEFTLYSKPVEFTEIEFASQIATVPQTDKQSDSNINSSKTIKKLSPKEYPIGRLSGIKAGTRTFQIQTEVALSPVLQVVTIVVLDGRTLLKRATGELKGDEDINQLIGTQHESVENEVREKLLNKIEKKKDSQTSGESFTQLLDKGLDEFMVRNYAEAVKIWEKAITLEPSNKALEVNLRIAREKLKNI
jgi:DNA-binding response OmpR family regulator